MTGEVHTLDPADGRAARRDRNRTAVLDAVIALFSQDNLDPGPDEVALRVGLSRRSVYRYFDDREALVRAAIDRHFEGVADLFVIDGLGEGPLPARIETFVACRLRAHQAVAATHRAARIRATFDDIVRERLEHDRDQLRDQADAQFAPELDAFDPRRRRSALAAVDTLCQFESLDLYRVHRGFSQAETAALLGDVLHALLHP